MLAKIMFRLAPAGTKILMAETLDTTINNSTHIVLSGQEADPVPVSRLNAANQRANRLSQQPFEAKNLAHQLSCLR
jgi:hypothetical protein